MRSTLLNVAFAGTAAFSLSTSAVAQCGLDDQLSAGGCCSQVGLNIPSFPDFGIQSKAIRWDACGLAAQGCVTVSFGSPMPTPRCGVFDIEAKVIDCAGVALLEGKGTLDYTRTWTEVRPQSVGTPPTDYQVWRFLLKIDMTAPVLPSLHPLLPNSLNSCPSVFYYGHVDYASDCATGLLEHSVSMYHGADRFSHGPIISSCASTLDPISSFAIVGPDTAANPFVPSDFLINPGSLQAEAMRSVDSPVPFACNVEERIAQGFFNPVGFGCLTPPSTASIHQSSVDVSAFGQCGSNFQTLNVGGGVIPWRRLISTSLGRWSTNSVYPGPEALRADEGLFVYNDSCVGTPDFVVFYGAETLGGYQVVPGPTPSVLPSQHFVDLVSNWTAPIGGVISLPLLGDVQPSKYLIYVNPQ